MSLAEAREPDEPLPSSGERLLKVLAALDMTGYQFAAYWAGFSLDEALDLNEKSERGGWFRANKRAIHRWTTDIYPINEAAAYDIILAANQLLKTRRKRQFRADFLVTPEEERVAGMVELRALLDDVIERVERLERKAR